MKPNQHQTDSAPGSRWFRVIAENWDWMPSRNVMVSFKRGVVDFRPLACIEAGLAASAIEVIEKPVGYSVDKAGNVVSRRD